jgi:hypothetical protein
MGFECKRLLTTLDINFRIARIHLYTYNHSFLDT